MDWVLSACERQQSLGALASNLNHVLSRIVNLHKEITALQKEFTILRGATPEGHPFLQLVITSSKVQVVMRLELSARYPHCTLPCQVRVCSTRSDVDEAMLRSRVVRLVAQTTGFGRLAKIAHATRNEIVRVAV